MNHLLVIKPCLALLGREIIRFLRQRNRITGAFLTPLVFWVLIGAGVGDSFNPAGTENGGGYLAYFFPGTLVLIVLFTAIFSTISIIEDRREGFLQGVLVAPVHPLAIVGGKVLGGALLALMQAILFCVFAPTAGITISIAQIAPLVGVLFLTGIGLTALGYVIAWPMDSTMGFHAIMNVFLIPLWLLSGALFPPSGSATWIGWIIYLNPLYYALSAVRYFLGSAPPEGIALPSLGLSLTVTILSTIILLILCVWMTLKINRKM